MGRDIGTQGTQVDPLLQGLWAVAWASLVKRVGRSTKLNLASGLHTTSQQGLQGHSLEVTLALSGLLSQPRLTSTADGAGTNLP
eukprot:5481268-Amphidinium_carterae.1